MQIHNDDEKKKGRSIITLTPARLVGLMIGTALVASILSLIGAVLLMNITNPPEVVTPVLLDAATETYTVTPTFTMTATHTPTPVSTETIPPIPAIIVTSPPVPTLPPTISPP